MILVSNKVGIPKEIIKMIYERCNEIDNRILFHKIWDSNLFFTKKRSILFINSFSKKFINILSSILRFKATRIELIKIIRASINK